MVHARIDASVRVFRTPLDPYTRKRFAMRDTEADRQAARDFARMRAADVAHVRTMPPLAPGKWYSKRRDVRGADEWRVVPALFVSGPVAIVQQGSFDVVDLSGLRIDSFYERADAERLARALAPCIDAMFTRAAMGNVFAMRSPLRLCRIHKSAARRRGPTGKPWTKRELKALETAEQWGNRRGKVGANVSPERAKELLVLVGLSECAAFPDDKLRHWYMRLRARVEREGLPSATRPPRP